MELILSKELDQKNIQLYRPIRKHQPGIGQDPKEMCGAVGPIQIIGP
jgi:hypothetical protein